MFSQIFQQKNMTDCNKHWNGSFNVLTVFYGC